VRIYADPFNFCGVCRARDDRGFVEATGTKRKREAKKIAINLLETTSQFNPLLLLLLTPKTSKGLVSEYFFLSNFFLKVGSWD
jgi:hypothetical protein